MTDEPKDVRLPFMVTASEAKVIDEWRYRNHIPSRAEAMRLLINRGIKWDEAQDLFRSLTSILVEILKGGKLSEAQVADFSSAVNRNASTVKSISEFEYKNFESIRKEVDAIVGSMPKND
ncbi:hypothetical protein QLQ09_23500 [Brucella sp. NM4]|uniref:hypothetical protein n=1 Tax=Brucella/Ochrobactrum group TaxID=2826938 RepID=UPI0024BBEEBA|nr:hypothetical protein [Brucella sp. NM4]WHS33225.1 hypothetical protein QLQ09_23500 [Brucella sp. NM4]WHT43325.1 hypothetical protein QLQ11_15550 [Ochrobactrum sp. SSR]